MKPTQKIELPPTFIMQTDDAISPLLVWNNHPDFAQGLTWQQLQQVGVALLNMSLEGMEQEKKMLEQAYDRVRENFPKQASEPPLCITCDEGVGQFHCNHCDKDYCPTCFPGHPCACHIYDRVRENSAKQASEPPLCEACDMEVGWRQCNHCATALCAVCFPEHLCNRLGRVIDE